MPQWSSLEHVCVLLSFVLNWSVLWVLEGIKNPVLEDVRGSTLKIQIYFKWTALSSDEQPTIHHNFSSSWILHSAPAAFCSTEFLMSQCTAWENTYFYHQITTFHVFLNAVQFLYWEKTCREAFILPLLCCWLLHFSPQCPSSCVFLS